MDVLARIRLRSLRWNGWVVGAAAAAWFAVTGLAARSCAADEPVRDIRDYAAQAAAPEGTKRIMFIAARAEYGGRGSHEFLVGANYLARRINAVFPQAYAVVYSEDRWPETCADQDAVVVLLNHGGKAASDKRIADAVRRRAGFMAIHYGVEVNKGEQGNNYLDWMGGYFETYWSVNPHWKADITVNAGHPTARGVKPFTIDDEWYYNMRFREGMTGVTPILTAKPTAETIHFPMSKEKYSDRGGNPDVLRAVKAGEPQHLAWAYERPDGGRGFGFTGFHRFANLGDDSFRTVLLNGVAWVAKLDIPESGVPSPTPSNDDLEAMLDEVHGPKKKQ